jgi:hypothetical protein
MTDTDHMIYAPRGPIVRGAIIRLQLAFERFSNSFQGTKGPISSHECRRLAKNINEILRKIPPDNLQSLLNMPDPNSQLAKSCWLLDRIRSGQSDERTMMELANSTNELVKMVAKGFYRYFRPSSKSAVPSKGSASSKQEPAAASKPSILESDDDKPKTIWIRDR